MLLSCIDFPEDLRKLPLYQLPQLVRELRKRIITTVATKEGHLGASLGVVELTTALHYVFDTPHDLLVWDVGHQAYGHKILTGRKHTFDTNRQMGGISGFPKREESIYDTFGTGHSSTALSAALGMAIASQLKGETDRWHIAVIGDASIASGMAFEAINHLGTTNTNVLVILNDNAMSIDPSVGALKAHFTDIKKGETKKGIVFECFNLAYSGPTDGHDVIKLVRVLQDLKKTRGPQLLHVVTTKGKGLKKAEDHPVVYHAPGKFDANTGVQIPKKQEPQPPKYQEVFGHTIVELAQANEHIVGITPAMPTGSSLRYMMEVMPHRAFDVGIAEQHAVTLAAGMATQGLIPFCTIYSTFLQRAYDQVIHDVALQKLPVIFCIDRAGLVGQDGPTHHGVFDVAYLRCIPNLTLFAPMNEMELRNIMYTAQLGIKEPLAIRYPRGRGITLKWRNTFKPITMGTARCLREGSHIAVLTLGTIGNMVTAVLESLGNPKTVGHYDMRFVKPIDKAALHTISTQYQHILTVEDSCTIGGLGTAVLEFVRAAGYTIPITKIGIPDRFIAQGSMSETQTMARIDFDTLQSQIQSLLKS